MDLMIITEAEAARIACEAETPTLVQWYVDSRIRGALGVIATHDQHRRHCATVNELRVRGVIGH